MRSPTFLASCAATLAAAALPAPASAIYIETSGIIVDNAGFGDFGTTAFRDPPFTDLLSGERLFFRLEFQNAQFANAQYNQAFSTLSRFWVEGPPGVFNLGLGPDSGVASCSINPGQTCLRTNVSIALGTIEISHAGNVLSGFVGFDNVNFDECNGTLFHVVGPICSEQSGVIGPVAPFNVGELFASFTMPNGNGRYRFIIFSGSIPEPASWAMMIAGFGLAGGMLRQRRRTSVRFALNNG